MLGARAAAIRRCWSHKHACCRMNSNCYSLHFATDCERSFLLPIYRDALQSVRTEKEAEMSAIAQFQIQWIESYIGRSWCGCGQIQSMWTMIWWRLRICWPTWSHHCYIVCMSIVCRIEWLALFGTIIVHFHILISRVIVTVLNVMKASKLRRFVIADITTQCTPPVRMNLLCRNINGKVSKISSECAETYQHTCRLLITSASFGKSLTSSTRFRFMCLEKTCSNLAAVGMNCRPSCIKRYTFGWNGTQYYSQRNSK